MKRNILFVDDEPKILQGLIRMLRGMRGEWAMTFSESGPEALEILAREPFDVVVSDMRMPEMDGAQLLAEVKRCYPNVVRMILSGHSDKEMIMKSVRPTHQYLSKPCEAETLKSTIRRTCDLRDLLAHDSLTGVVSRMESLPSLPSLYSEIMELLESPDASIQKVGQIIAKDLGMTAKLLQLVNSAFFGIPRHISSPAQAVSLLGLDTVKALVLTVGVFSRFEQTRLPYFRINELMDHSTKTGAMAKELAKAEGIDKCMVDDAFMAGLLHDIGKLVLAANISDKYGEVLNLVRDEKMAFCEAEYEILGTTHAHVGAYLIGLWGLSDPIVEAIAFHHSPGICFSQGVCPLTAVHIGNALEHEDSHTFTMDAPISGVDYEYLDKLGLTERLPGWKEICTHLKEEERNNE